MGDCGAPGSVVCWKVRGCVGVCVWWSGGGGGGSESVGEEGGVDAEHTENQRLAEFCCKCLFFIQAQVTASRQVRHKWTRQI